MDPLSIATAVSMAIKAAKCSWETGETLYLFIKGTQIVNKTVKDLADTVKAFGDTCDLVRSSLETLAAAYTRTEGSFDTLRSKDDLLVWRGVQARLTECQSVIDDLQSSMSGIEKEHTHFVTQAWRQFKLNLNKEEMVTIQARLQNHTTALSLSLQAVKIRVDHLIPRQADKDLLHELKQLRQFIQDQHDAGEQIKPQDELGQYAQAVFDDGATLYKSSVGESTVVDDLDSWTIIGEPANNASLERIQQWTEDLSTLSLEHSSSKLSLESDSVLSGRPSLFTDDTSIDDGPASFLETENDFGDSDDEFDLELAKQTISDGSAAFEESNFEEANVVLADAVQQLQQISLHKRSSCNLADLQYKLAVCAFHLDAPARAAKKLVGFVQQPADNDSDRGNLCRAGHLLAQSYVSLDKLDLARSTCESALRGRRRLLGQQHHEYHDSMALMARILELGGNAVRARTFLGLVPAEQRSTLKDKYAELKCSAPATKSNNPTQPAQEPRTRKVENARAGEASTTQKERSDPTHFPAEHRKPSSTGYEASPNPFVDPAPTTDQATKSSANRPADQSDSTAVEHMAPSEREAWLEALDFRTRGPLTRRLVAGHLHSGPLHLETYDSSDRDATLALAALFGDYTAVQKLLKSGAEMERIHSISPTYSYEGRTAVKALHLALAAKQVKIVQLLIESGAALRSVIVHCISLLACLLHEPWLQLTKRASPAHILSTVRALGAGPTTVDGSGMTLLHWTTKLRDEFSSLRSNLTEHLLQQGASVLKTDKNGLIPLHHAVRDNFTSETIAKLLHIRPAEQVNAMDKEGRTALHYALSPERYRISAPIVRCLVDAGADIHFKRNVNVETPFSYAKGHHEKASLDEETLRVLAFRGF